MNLASGWLAYHNLCWSGFRHIAYQIRLRLLRPCKILTSTLISSCVLLMYPACSPTFLLMKPSKSVRKPSMTSLCPDQFIPKDVFVELMKSATSSVEFSFNNTMYKQTDGVAMTSPLGPALANILLLLLFTRPLPRGGGMAGDHGAPEAGQLSRVWTRGRKELESRQRVSGVKSLQLDSAERDERCPGTSVHRRCTKDSQFCLS